MLSEFRVLCVAREFQQLKQIGAMLLSEKCFPPPGTLPRTFPVQRSRTNGKQCEPPLTESASGHHGLKFTDVRPTDGHGCRPTISREPHNRSAGFDRAKPLRKHHNNRDSRRLSKCRKRGVNGIPLPSVSGAFILIPKSRRSDSESLSRN